MTDIRGSRALITGAASGIGRLLAAELGRAGASLVLWDLDGEGLLEAQAELRGNGCEVQTYVCDLTLRQDIEAVAAQTLAESGAVDILVNNAGIVSGKNLLDISPAEIERTFQVNTLALFWTAKAFLPGMLERDRGHLVTIASAAGLAGTSKLTDYCSSKFAAVGFDESLRVELKRQNSKIVTTVVCPFYTDTGMFEGVRTRFPWLLPILDPAYVVTRTVRAIEKDRRRLIMPRFVYSGLPSRLLPVDWFDALMAFFGISHSMDEFRGRE
ncbi:MAG: SDR family oxidoreductase [Gammaproteobacteria bacterium]|jgi:all-trans-retinol dehydrogenase (NAD+)|nr:SDR family oxidoreductase [Gammaproteobacteria bacterium]MDH3848328.1 SDR family oxidoreductase [Gammaproteobacteria bacterium]MDH3863093.1 SDR family oxidoreductase [Gammaproteobacteria bacterium]MDH4005405.1 SDR family oxidoreductase [Gammaproteobacteria bacterium]NCF60708.1 SDR family NAD(P)-dependent oxidoreductase [Gammaproteobacteria bacterium]